MIGALDGREKLFVADPWGRGPDFYTAVYRQIANAVIAAVTR